MENFSGNATENASGFVIEVNLDQRRGILATLIIKNGSIKKGMTVAVEDSTCSTRIMENFKGEMINEASFSSPIRIMGFDKMPRVGAPFVSFEKKTEALKYVEDWQEKKKSEVCKNKKEEERETGKKIIPIILKADVSGSIEAIEKEIAKIKDAGAEFRIIGKGIGPVTESDIKGITSCDDAIVIGFNVKADRSALEIAQKRNITISFFEIIYKMTEWLLLQMEEKRPKIETIETTGRAKIIRAFSRTKERQIVGGKVTEGTINLNSAVRIMRRDFEIGRGKIVNLEKNKTKTSEVSEGAEFGMMIESKIEVVAGDILESFSIIQK
jgi:translation initiation factor IF-2